MFSFDGDYRRTPVQSLGGASHNSDRETLIRKAQQERQKRAELRQQNNGATIIQSYGRSFLLRQQIKEAERQKFDALMAAAKGGTQSLTDLASLEQVLRQILFFYYFRNQRDGERLVGLLKMIINLEINFLFICILDLIESADHKESKVNVNPSNGDATVEISHQKVAVPVHATDLRTESFVAVDSVSYVGNVYGRTGIAALHRRPRCRTSFSRRHLHVFGATSILSTGTTNARRKSATTGRTRYASAQRHVGHTAPDVGASTEVGEQLFRL